MNRYSADAVMASLKDFQRSTVDHVIDRFYGSDSTRRFLVADETGLGKSVVAKGVIAKMLERLQDDDSVKRIDVIYVCSNQDIAAQNLDRLKVTASESVTLSSRLTLLARHSSALHSAKAIEGKPVNLVAFTPGTSFDKGWSTGKAEERALLFLLLERMNEWDGWTRHAALRALQGTVATPASFERQIGRMATDLGPQIDTRISREFRRLGRKSGQFREFSELLVDIGRQRTLQPDLRRRSFELTGKLRTSLARAGLATLDPDLVILDEFQRFRHLLSIQDGGESAELAQELFNHGNAKVLLLSATPYKPFTLAEEAKAGDDHWQDFRQMLSFLCDDPQWASDLSDGFQVYREALVRGVPSDTHRARLRELLLRVMCRTERPPLGKDGMLRECYMDASDVRREDVRGYVVMRQMADAVEAPMSLDYWKSAPYFLNFTDGYKVGEQIRVALKAGRRAELSQLLDQAQLINAAELQQHQQIDMGNARMRQLAHDTVDAGWWKLLWVPPSMPHYQLAEPFVSLADAGMTKRLLFSSWAATPTAVAGLLSYEADRQTGGTRLSGTDPTERRRISSRLEYRLDSDRPAGMSTLALFWPHPALATLCDPLAFARRFAAETQPLSDMQAAVRDRIVADSPDDLCSAEHAGDIVPWQAFLRWPAAGLPSSCSTDAATAAMGGQSDQDDETSSGLARHVADAVAFAGSPRQPASSDPAVFADDVMALGMHSPANVAWRALSRIREADTTITDGGHWRAAAIIANGLRSLFNRPESIALLDQLELDAVYWRSVLRYCAVGGLQAVLDEYVHHLRSSMSSLALDDDALLKLADEVAKALSIRSSVYRAFDPMDPDKTIPLPSRFALRYGGRRDDAEAARQPEVRNAFNSPFWPFVLATTSAGQEGIDFHWWCSAVVHWNTPANPVDFEQREGRVHRFGGHAIRRNIAARHREEALSASGENDVWKSAYDAARRESGQLGDFAPYWVYAGDAKIERYLMPYPLSRDVPKVQRLKNDLVMYRLAFGQPRQEDLLALLNQVGDSDNADTLALDLRP